MNHTKTIRKSFLSFFNSKFFFALGFAPLLTFSLSANADVTLKPGEKRPQFNFKEAATIPIQAGGRIKPFDSYARDSVLQITGRYQFDGWNPTDLVFSWIAFPREWEDRAFILVSRKDVRKQLGLDESRSRFSPNELFNQSYLKDYAKSLSQEAQGLNVRATPIEKTTKPDERETELKEVFGRVQLFNAIVSGEAWPVIPRTSEDLPWLTLSSKEMDQSTEGDPIDMGNVKIKQGYLAAITTYMANNQEGFQEAVSTIKKEVIQKTPHWDQHTGRSIQLETWYNHTHPFQWAWIFYTLAAILWVFTRFLEVENAKKLVKIAIPLTVVGFIFHSIGFGIRCYIAGRPPVTNMYETIVWVSYGVLIFSAILWRYQKNTILFAVSTTIGAIALIISDAIPAMIDPGIRPLIPVLRSNYWLTLHVMTITISYAALALTMGLSNVALYHFIRGNHHTPEGNKKIFSINQLSYRAMQFGVVLLAAGTILGGIWADYSWGRFWGWDPKEVWALIALMGYMIILHARYTGWMKSFGFAAFTVLSFTLVLMAWYGVNFILGAGLHSYGFSSGGQSFMIGYVILQTLYVIAANILRKKTARSSEVEAEA